MFYHFIIFTHTRKYTAKYHSKVFFNQAKQAMLSRCLVGSSQWKVMFWTVVFLSAPDNLISFATSIPKVESLHTDISPGVSTTFQSVLDYSLGFRLLGFGFSFVFPQNRVFPTILTIFWEFSKVTGKVFSELPEFQTRSYGAFLTKG